MLATYIVRPSVGEPEPVVGDAELGEDGRRGGRVGDVDRGQRLPRARRPERAPVGREAALVTEQPGRRAGQQPRLPAVRPHVVQVDDARVGARVGEHRGEDAALLVQQQRLVRAQHRGRGERAGLPRLRRVVHVEHDRAEALDRVEEHVLGEQQRRVVEGTRAPAPVAVPQHLEAAGVAVVADLTGVALVAALDPAAGVVRGRHPALVRRLGAGARTAVGRRGRRGERVRRPEAGGCGHAGDQRTDDEQGRSEATDGGGATAGW